MDENYKEGFDDGLEAGKSRGEDGDRTQDYIDRDHAWAESRARDRAQAYRCSLALVRTIQRGDSMHCDGTALRVDPSGDLCWPDGTVLMCLGDEPTEDQFTVLEALVRGGFEVSREA